MYQWISETYTVYVYIIAIHRIAILLDWKEIMREIVTFFKINIDYIGRNIGCVCPATVYDSRKKSQV